MSENDVGFFVNLEKEAPAAKPVHFAKLPTAFVTQKNSLLPRQPAEGNFTFCTPVMFCRPLG